MSFREKSIAISTAALIVAALAYVVVVLRLLSTTPVSEVTYQPALVGAVVLLVIIVIAGNVAAAIADPRAANATADERERLIQWRGQSMGGYVLAIGAFATLCLAMAEVDWFWIANVLAGTWVLSEVWSGMAKLVLFRRGV